MGYNGLRDQVKTYSSEFNAADVLISELPNGMTLSPSPRLECFSDDTNLRSMKMRELTEGELQISSCLERK